MVEVDCAFGVGLFKHSTNLHGDVEHLFHAEVADEITAGVAGIAEQVEVIFPAAFEDQKRQPAVLQPFLVLVNYVLDFIQIKECKCAADRRCFALFSQNL